MTTGTRFSWKLPSGHGACTACIGGLGGVISKLVVVIVRRMNFGFGAIPAAYHALHLLSELVVQQCEYKRVDGRINQDHRVSNNGW